MITPQGQTGYINGIHYKDGSLDFLQTAEGKLDMTDHAYYYNVMDHLGNVRLLVDKDGAVEQSTDYYPFGLIARGGSTAANKYLYNNKELQEEIGWYDYGARMYDPAIGRFMVHDPLAEAYYSLSPYGYVAGNPIAAKDENGEWINFVVGAAMGAATDYAFQVGVNLVDGKGWDSLTDIDGVSIVTSAAAGALGVGIGNTINKGVKAMKAAKVITNKTGQKVTEHVLQAASDATISVVGNIVQVNEITVEGTFIDVGTGQLGKGIGDKVKNKAQNSPTGTNKRLRAERAQKNLKRKPNNSSKQAEASSSQKSFDTHGDNRSIAAGSVGSNAPSKVVKAIKEEKKKLSNDER
ncbi:RHS repeat-associated core domain-containing protein [Persicobacter diffluens]|uniref:RHS repeat-associated core domain-containing protein n=1 Tax=Persicobacter diffluens TaxID=981 RepID=A0AAN4W1R5_9BACT|nr:hypothetical protein PEDI_47510 [Persicobacter diffluens]